MRNTLFYLWGHFLFASVFHHHFILFLALLLVVIFRYFVNCIQKLRFRHIFKIQWAPKPAEKTMCQALLGVASICVGTMWSLPTLRLLTITILNKQQFTRPTFISFLSKWRTNSPLMHKSLHFGRISSWHRWFYKYFSFARPMNS